MDNENGTETTTTPRKAYTMPTPGDVIRDRYEVQEELGQGAFAKVYRATDTKIGGDVALKVLKPNRSADRSFVDRFHREVLIVRKLRHPNTIKIWDAGETEQGCLYIASEFVDGLELAKIIEGGDGLPVARACRITRQILRSLAEAHRNGIVHRDLKPRNIMICQHEGVPDYVKVLDFGIAKSATSEADALTRAGELVCTPIYAAPELARAEKACPQSDLYSTGLLLLEMLTGKPAVGGRSAMEILAKQASPTPVKIPGFLVRSSVGEVIKRAVEKKIEDRYASALEMLEELGKVEMNEELPGADSDGERADRPEGSGAPRSEASGGASGSASTSEDDSAELAWAESVARADGGSPSEVAFADSDAGLYILADGVGRETGLEAATIFHRIAREHMTDAAIRIQGSDERARDAWVEAIRAAIDAASQAIFSRAAEGSSPLAMSTTGIILKLLDDRHAVAGHVGDSRLYLARDGQALKLTEEHTLLHQLRSLGRLSDEELENFPHKNVLARAIGQQPVVEADLIQLELRVGDRFLLCSRGLAQRLPDERLRRIITTEATRRAAKSLIAAATEGGGHPDLSVISVRVGSSKNASSSGLSMEERLGALAGVYLFQELKLAQLMRLLRVVEERSVRGGEVLCTEGQEGEELFVVVEGEVAVSKSGAHLTTVGPGDHFGDLAVFGGGVRSATVVANGNARLLLVRRSELLELMSSDQALGFQLLWRFVEKLGTRLKESSEELAQVMSTGQLPALRL